MQVDISSSDAILLDSLPSSTQEKLSFAEKALVVKVIPLKEEKNDDFLVLSYAFYKDFAHYHNLRIPTYYDMWSVLEKEKTKLYHFMAYEGKIPVAALLVGKSSHSLDFILCGSVRAGIDYNAPYLLVWEAMKYAKTLDISIFSFSSQTFQPFPQVKKLHSNLLRGFTAAPEEVPEISRPLIPALPRRLSVSKLLATRR